jgi:hypothetical protein
MVYNDWFKTWMVYNDQISLSMTRVCIAPGSLLLMIFIIMCGILNWNINRYMCCIVSFIYYTDDNLVIKGNWFIPATCFNISDTIRHIGEIIALKYVFVSIPTASKSVFVSIPTALKVSVCQHSYCFKVGVCEHSYCLKVCVCQYSYCLKVCVCQHSSCLKVCVCL